MNLSLAAIFGAGLLTFASPCVLPLVPVYLSLLAGASVGELRSGAARGRLVAASAAFALGLAVVFVAMGMAATAAGRLLLDHRTALSRVGGAVVILFGLKFIGVLRAPWLEREFRPGLDALGRRGGLLAAFLFGAAFGLGWTPCIGPVLGAVLTYTASATANPWMGGLYLGVYALGLALPLLAAAAVAPVALGWIRRAQKHARRFELATGLALVAMGALLVTDKLGSLGASMTPAAPPVVAAHDAPCASDASTCGMPTVATADEPSSAASLPDSPVMVEFVSRSCTVCARMAPLVQSIDHACSGVGVGVHRVDVGSPSGRELARRHGVVGVPTFVTLERGQRVRARLVGEQSREQLVEAMEDLAGAHCGSDAHQPVAPSRS